MVLPDSHGISRVPRYSGTSCATFDFAYGPFTLYGVPSQVLLLSTHGSLYGGPTTPDARKHLVWASPISLAATLGISFDFFSSGYWDVSLPQVVPRYSSECQPIASRFPRRTSTANNGCRDLTVAFRTLLRPFLSGYPRHPSCALKQDLILSRYM